jgi:hypothetical protein
VEGCRAKLKIKQDQEGLMWSWLKSLKGKDAPPSLLDKLLEEARRSELPDRPADREILALDPRGQAGFVVEIFRAYAEAVLSGGHITPQRERAYQVLVRVASQLMRRRLPYQEEDFIRLAEVIGAVYINRAWNLPMASFVRALEDHAKESGLSPALREALKPLPDHLDGLLTTDRRRILERMRQLLRQDDSGEPGFELRGGDAWADALREELAALPPEETGTWREILVHCAMTGSTRPSAKWLGRARDLLGRLPQGEASRVLALSLSRVGRPPARLDDSQIDLLRGLVWCAGLVERPEGVLGDAAEACFRKVPGHGPLSARTGNACVDMLSRLDTPESVAQLSRLGIRVKHPPSQRRIEAALGQAAGRLGLTPAELEERFVPTPETPKEIQKALPVQRDRLERLYLVPREWDLATWRELYLDHPLVGTLARRLIWRFDGAGGSRTGLWRGGEIVDAEGRPLTGLDGTRVALWHPLDSDPAQVLAWRRALEDGEVVQPFKQAHREIYLLTDAERQTHTYSNRFAAHILKQHQFAALCRQRGWIYSLQGQWDSENTPVRRLPELDLQVEFWVEAVADRNHVSESGIYLYITTDQVRFCDAAGVPRPLEQIPPLLFSELMRDVDLFVGVCSVGNDPAWGDQAERPGRGYWSVYSSGELSESARTRRDLLQRLIPRLKIADRCSLTDRFLVVRGDLRTYKIHLGSTNIFMEPNDQYLCIVQDRSKAKGRQPPAPVRGRQPDGGDPQQGLSPGGGPEDQGPDHREADREGFLTSETAFCRLNIGSSICKKHSPHDPPGTRNRSHRHRPTVSGGDPDGAASVREDHAGSRGFSGPRLRIAGGARSSGVCAHRSTRLPRAVPGPRHPR